VPLSVGDLGPHLTQCRLGRRLYLRTKWHLNPSSRLATVDMGRKLGGWRIFGRTTWVPYLTQCRLGRCLPTYQV